MNKSQFYMRDKSIPDSVEAVLEIDKKLKETNDEKERTRLMFEQMLRGLSIQTNPLSY